MQGTVKGERRQGRRRKKWEDNIREWTGPEFAKSQRAVRNGVKWRKLVAKSFELPQRSSRSKDGWMMMMMMMMMSIAFTEHFVSNGDITRAPAG